MANKMILTSLPFGWLDIKLERSSEYTHFVHDYSSMCFGSARKASNDFNALERLALLDIKETLKVNF